MNSKNLQLRITIMQFIQYFIWGSWLITIGAYWFQTKQWSGTEFGAIFSTMGISAIFMPALMGIIADRWINAERLYSLCHLGGAVSLFFIPRADNPHDMFWIMLVNMLFYMPTISLSITISYSAMKEAGIDIVKKYPQARFWGTVGFISALWTVSLTGLETSPAQFYLAGLASLILALYGLTMPKCLPLGKSVGSSWTSTLGLDAFSLFKNYNMAIFFIFAMLLGASLQLTNAYGDTFLHDFKNFEIYKDTFAIKYPAVIMSISQISETLFILTIPFFLGRFGIKRVMTISMIAWVFRFGLLSYGNPGNGLWMIILSCIIYGMAFDFFNISGSLFVESQVTPDKRASAQGLFMMMVNGFGAFFGSSISGWLIDHYYRLPSGQIDWHGTWFAFASYSLIVVIGFLALFRYNDKSKSTKS